MFRKHINATMICVWVCLLSIWIFCEERAGEWENANNIFHLEVHISVGKQCTHQSVVMMVNAHTIFSQCQSERVCVPVPVHVSKKRREKKIAEANRYKNASSIDDFSWIQLKLSSTQRNETENFCLFVSFSISHSDEFTWLFRFLCVDFIPWLMNAVLRLKFMCMICSVWFIFMFSKANAWVCFSFSIHFC